MSVIISTPDQILNHPINTSSAKQLYSFPKDVRFKPTPKGVCAQTCYTLPTTKSKRKAAFGYGKKYDFMNVKNTGRNPPPNNYDIKSTVKVNKAKAKGKTFGLSRLSMSATGNRVITKGFPGPGQYEHQSQLKKVSYSMRMKTLNPYSYSSAKKVPGPGQYSILPGISLDGKYPISKYRNSCTRYINPASSTRFQKRGKPRAPGPGVYDRDKQSMAKNGEYFFSRFKNSQCRTFGQAQRNTWGIKKRGGNPGPGYYRIPSDFGYYESSKVKRRFGAKTAGVGRRRRSRRSSLHSRKSGIRTNRSEPQSRLKNKEVVQQQPTKTDQVAKVQ